MKKLSILFTFLFVIGMMTSSALAQCIPPDCDDGVDCTDDICDEVSDVCSNIPNDGVCNDGQYCNGIETCDPVNDCQAGIPPDCDDGVDCTDDICDEDVDVCVNNPNDGYCDDGQYCNGMEFCDPILDCLLGDLPCTENEICDEVSDLCLFDGTVVSADIKPGSCPSPLNVRSRGVLPVAILGTDDLDVSTIDPATIKMTIEGIEVSEEDEEKLHAIRHSYEDVGTPFEGELCDCHELRKDGLMDLILKFRVPPLVGVLGLTDFESKETIPLTIMGETYDGVPIRGEDCVKIINNLKPFEDMLKKWLDNIPKRPKKPKKPKKPKNGGEE